MRKSPLVLLIFAMSLILPVFVIQIIAQEESMIADIPRPCVRGTFPNAHGEPPADWDGSVFELSQEYPDELAPMEDYPWLTIDVVNGAPIDPYAYIMAVKEYVFEGNVEVDFVVQENSVRDWYHLPWMHYGANGREFIRGLTHELDSPAQQLHPEQTGVPQTWAVSVINDRGAWAIGNVWCDPDNPRPEWLNPNSNEPNWLPDGAAQFKLLFTTATDDPDSRLYVPYLENTMEWTANIYTNPPGSRDDDPARSPQTVRLIQVDVAVRDSRIEETGWVFGTFLYDNTLGIGETAIDRLVPVGLMWGNDPGITPQMSANGTPLRESWINTAVTTNGGDHLGWGGRLNGPMDNPLSSCMSCHMTAGYPEGSIMPDFSPTFSETTITPEIRLAWMVNIPAGVAFQQDQCHSLDYSLQTQIGLQNWQKANSITIASSCADDRDIETDRDTENGS